MRTRHFVVALILALTTMAFMTAHTARAGDAGDYHCCGNSGCTELVATTACPAGDNNCGDVNGHRHCCGDNPGEASCYMKIE